MTITWTLYGTGEHCVYRGDGYEIHDLQPWGAYCTGNRAIPRWLGDFPTLHAAVDACEADLKRQPHDDGEN